MEVVVAFTNGNKGSDDMVARGVLVIKRSVSKPVSERVDTEGRLEIGHVSVTREYKTKKKNLESLTWCTKHSRRTPA